MRTGCWLPWAVAESRVPVVPTGAVAPAGPPATTLPPGPAVTPVTDVAEDLPRWAVCRQDHPCTLTNATRYRPAEPAATTPWSLPATEVTSSAAPRPAVSTPPKRQAGLRP